MVNLHNHSLLRRFVSESHFPRGRVPGYPRIMAAKNRRVGAKLTRRQTFWERLWAGSIVLYSVGATFVVWRTLGKYGVSAILFFIIDVMTSWPYGIATARIVVNVVKHDWKEVRKWSWVAAITFITPQVYILASARHAPRDVYLIVIIVITLLVLFALFSVLLHIRHSKRIAAGASE
jgi:hypothetical protein